MDGKTFDDIVALADYDEQKKYGHCEQCDMWYLLENMDRDSIGRKVCKDCKLKLAV